MIPSRREHGTCNVACWQAVELECNCQCLGKNHGIMRRGGGQPGRQTQRKIGVYDLVAVTDNWTEADKAGQEAEAERGLIHSWRNPTRLIERATERTLKWPEVQAVRTQSKDTYPTTWLAWVKSPPIPTDPVRRES